MLATTVIADRSDDMEARRAERIANNAILAAWARISMALVVPLAGLGGVWLKREFDNVEVKVADVKSDVAGIKEDIEPIAVIQAHVAEALNTARAAKQESEQNAKQLASLASRQDHDDVENARFQAAITKLAEAVAGLTSTVQNIYDDRQRAPPR